jgi:hypothetical protein
MKPKKYFGGGRWSGKIEKSYLVLCSLRSRDNAQYPAQTEEPAHQKVKYTQVLIFYIMHIAFWDTFWGILGNFLALFLGDFWGIFGPFFGRFLALFWPFRESRGYFYPG